MTTHDDIRAILEGWGGRPSVAVINLDQLRANIHALRAMVGDGVKLMSVVKADGYGHGSVPVAKVALAAGADELAVATVEEGVRLREAGIDGPVLVMGPIGVKERPRAITHNLMLVVSDADFARGLAADVRFTGRKEPVDVHLKIDSGMRRFGVSPESVVELANVIGGLGELRLVGVMTHFAAADDPDPSFTIEQADRFDRACNAIRDAGIEVPGVHLSNSAATLRFPEMRRDRVRVGIAMYGLRPDPDMELPGSLRPVLTVHSRVSRLVHVEPGEGVSYGLTWTAEAPGTVALVPIGYADGYRRQGSNLAWMDAGGVEAPVRGRICMDQTLVGVADHTKVADLVTVVGDGHHGVAPSLNQLAKLYGTITHEMATNFAVQRLAHLFVQDGKLVAVSDIAGYRELDGEALTRPGVTEGALAGAR